MTPEKPELQLDSTDLAAKFAAIDAKLRAAIEAEREDPSVDYAGTDDKEDGDGPA
jgi:hypothetical protein